MSNLCTDRMRPDMLIFCTLQLDHEGPHMQGDDALWAGPDRIGPKT
jgi:hypothetical protein